MAWFKEKTSPTRPEDKVPLGEKLAIGAGAFPTHFGTAGIKSMAIPVYQMTLGVDPALLGIILAIPRLWDAFTDPIMGKISDNFQSRWGRRRPFILGGSLVMGLLFALIWMVPESFGQTAALGYFIVTSFLFFTAFTVYSVPLTSLFYEMTPDYNERTRVMAFNSLFTKVASFVYNWTFPLAQYLAAAGLVAGTLAGVRVVGWGIGILVMMGMGVLPALFTRERYYRKVDRSKRVNLIGSLREAFRNRAFVVLIFITMASSAAGMLTANLDYYLLVYFMNDGDLTEGSYWKGILSSGYALTGLISIYPLLRISTVLGKRATMGLIYAMCVVGGVLKWFIYVPGADWLILLDPLLCAPVYVGLGMVAQSMMADVCDNDELHHGRRREGMFGSIYTWITKCGFSLSFLVSGLTLNLISFDVALGGDQTPQTFLLMRLCVAGSASISASIGLIFLFFYPITATQAEETRTILEDRRGKVE